MNESITRAAGAAFGQELPPLAMESLIREAGTRAAAAKHLLRRCFNGASRRGFRGR